MAGSADRMPRLLALVPYLLAHPGVRIAEAAQDFEVSETQLRRDLELLWMCGLPGHTPGDLIDLSFDGDTVSVTFDAGMSRPLTLTGDEALALVVALRTLAELPGVTNREALHRALAKVESIVGGSVEAADAVQVALDTETRMLTPLRQAVQEQRAVSLRYYTAARDEMTERVVDPVRIFTAQGRGYLEAWCRRAEGMRVFRVDRIELAEVLAEPSRPPEDLEPRDMSQGVYSPAPQHLQVDLEVGPGYYWIAEYYAGQTVAETGAARQIAVRVSDPAWVRALVLGSAGAVRVLSPGFLVEDVRAAAARALAAYPSTPGPGGT